MLHDTGKVLLNNHARGLRQRSGSSPDEGRSLYAIEREEFGFDHTVVGGLMLKRGPGDRQCGGLAPSADELDMVPAHSPHCCSRRAGNDLAHSVGLTVGGVKTKLDAESNAAAITLGFDQAKVDALSEDLSL